MNRMKNHNSHNNKHDDKNNDNHNNTNDGFYYNNSSSSTQQLQQLQQQQQRLLLSGEPTTTTNHYFSTTVSDKNNNNNNNKKKNNKNEKRRIETTGTTKITTANPPPTFSSSSSSSLLLSLSSNLILGDLNILFVTDVHSWIYGRRSSTSTNTMNVQEQKQKQQDLKEDSYYNVNYGQVISFHEHLSKRIKEHQQQQLQQQQLQQQKQQHVRATTTTTSSDDDNNINSKPKHLLFVMNGDFVDGTGYSNGIPPKSLIPLIQQMPFDAINIGNHELYHTETIEYLRQPSGFIEHWNGTYLTSNTFYNHSYYHHSGSTSTSDNSIRSSRATTITTTQQKNEQQQQQEQSSSSSSSTIPRNDFNLQPLGSRYTILRTTTTSNNNQEMGVLTFGFLYNMENYCPNTYVKTVEETLDEPWFHNALIQHENEYQVILILAHMDCEDSLVYHILKTIRTILSGHKNNDNDNEEIPIIFITGHTHRRAVSFLNTTNVISIEAGHFLDTIGFVSLSFPQQQKQQPPQLVPVSPTSSSSSITTSLQSPPPPPVVVPVCTFQYKFIDANEQVLYDFLNITNKEEFDTPNGLAFTNLLETTRETLHLDTIVGYIPHSYYLDHYNSSTGTPTNIDNTIDSNHKDDTNFTTSRDNNHYDNNNNSDSLWDLYMKHVIPNTIFQHFQNRHEHPSSSSMYNMYKFYVQSTGALRYDLYEGTCTYDNLIEVSPFNDTSIQYQFINDNHPNLNNNNMNDSDDNSMISHSHYGGGGGGGGLVGISGSMLIGVMKRLNSIPNTTTKGKYGLPRYLSTCTVPTTTTTTSQQAMITTPCFIHPNEYYEVYGVDFDEPTIRSLLLKQMVLMEQHEQKSNRENRYSSLDDVDVDVVVVTKNDTTIVDEDEPFWNGKNVLPTLVTNQLCEENNNDDDDNDNFPFRIWDPTDTTTKRCWNTINVWTTFVATTNWTFIDGKVDNTTESSSIHDNDHDDMMMIHNESILVPPPSSSPRFSSTTLRTTVPFVDESVHRFFMRNNSTGKSSSSNPRSMFYIVVGVVVACMGLLLRRMVHSRQQQEQRKHQQQQPSEQTYLLQSSSSTSVV